MNTVWTNIGLALRLHDTGMKMIWIRYEMNTVRNEYGMKEYRIGLASTRCRHENAFNTVWNEYGTPAGLIWIRHHVNTRIRYDFIPLATVKGLIHSFEFCFDSFISRFILIHSFEQGWFRTCITNLGKGIISCRIHFAPASCKRGLIYSIKNN